jgi:glycosyltransferase involved in cell wall biosynthesis
MGKLKIIMVAYQRVIPLRIAIDCILLQTDPDWELYIIHDGKAPAEVKRVIEERADPRIFFCESSSVNGKWGHPNRRYMLENISANAREFVLITNDDNYYVPTFIAMLRGYQGPGVGMIYYNTLHSYFDYVVHESIIKECHIDMGAFIVRGDVAKTVGFNHDKGSADGLYAEECARYCQSYNLKISYIPTKVPFIHN